MSRLSTSFRVRGVDRVVAEQLLGGLEAGQRRRPLAGVLLAVEEHADLRAVTLLADPHHRVLERTARDVRVRRSSRKSDRLTFSRGCTIPAPALPRYVERDEQRVRRGRAR